MYERWEWQHCPMTTLAATALAHPNFAFIKYRLEKFDSTNNEDSFDHKLYPRFTFIEHARSLKIVPLEELLVYTPDK